MQPSVAILSLHSSPIAEPGLRDVGGMNIYVRRLAEGLAADGARVDVFTRRTSPTQPNVVRLGPRTSLVHLDAGPRRGLPKREIPLHVPEMTCSLVDFARRHRRNYDLLYAHYWVSGLVAERYRLTAEYHPPLLQMFHTLALVKELYSGAADPADSALRADAERRLVGRADVVVGNTRHEAREITALYGRSPRRFATIPPGVDTTLFRHIEQSQARRALGMRETPTVLYVGRFDRLKGLPILLQALAALPAGAAGNVRLVLVGGDDGPERRRYVRLAIELGIRDRIQFCGRVPQDELPLYFSAADVCAIPSLHESFGMTALEAMACETPVVATRTGGLAVTIQDGVTGYLAAPGNVESFRDSLHAALTSPDRQSIVRRARLAAERNTWGATVSRTQQLFDDVLSHGLSGTLAASGAG